MNSKDQYSLLMLAGDLKISESYLWMPLHSKTDLRTLNALIERL